MYKHILIPTDGSLTAAKAVAEGMRFAREAHARVTLFTAVPEYRLPSESEVMARQVVSLVEHERSSREKAEAILADGMQRAREEGVECETDYSLSDEPYRAIIAAAKRHGCDLIVMSSHGRRGIRGLLLGSETRDVLTHSTIPTLVYR